MFNNEIVPGFDDHKDDNCRITLQKTPDIAASLILELEGYIDTYNSGFFQKRIQKALEAGFVRLIFNCSGLNYVSSTGIGSFTTFLQTAKVKGGDVVLLSLQPKVFEVFQLLGFSQFFPIKDDLEESIAYFRMSIGGEEAVSFPKIFPCPVCTKNLKAAKPGRFRCSECKTILTIDNMGVVSLG